MFRQLENRVVVNVYTQSHDRQRERSRWNTTYSSLSETS
jgi:hypothetical protein